VLAQARPALAACEAPRTLDGCTEIARVRAAALELSSSTCYVDARVHAAFEFTYVERPISGGSCASSSCTARADVVLLR
jgi:hypothetical protein